jgi:hypothetical protein
MKYWQQRWRVSPGALLLLAGMMCLMLLIVAIPDGLDLPDAAFHRGTSPVLVHARATAMPAAASLSAIFHFIVLIEKDRTVVTQRLSAILATPNFLPIFLRSIRR